MSRNVKKPEIRKQELITIAMKQFIDLGYEKTSIRSIVGGANGEVGMFYHYFSSKEEIFNAVLQQYNANFIERLTALAKESNERSFTNLMNLILLEVDQAITNYSNIQPGKVDTKMLILLHHNALLAIKPIFGKILFVYIQKKEITSPIENTEALADFLLFGMSAILHDSQIDDNNTKTESIKALFNQVLSIRLEE